MTLGKFLRDYSLGIVLALLFFFSLLAQGVFGWYEFAADQQAHGEAAALFGSSGYIWRFLAATFENWQSEFLQLFTMAVLTAFLIHRGSAESKDSDDEAMLVLTDIRHRVMQLEKKVKS